MDMDKLKPKQSAFITRVGGDGALRHHLLDMGLTPGTEITLQKIAPMGDPIQRANVLVDHQHHPPGILDSPKRNPEIHLK